jgi:hypothetical protein
LSDIWRAVEAKSEAMSHKRKRRGDTIRNGIRAILANVLHDDRFICFRGVVPVNSDGVVRTLLDVIKEMVIGGDIPVMLKTHHATLTICSEAVINPVCSLETLMFDSSSSRTKWHWDIREDHVISLLHWKHMSWIKNALCEIAKTARPNPILSADRYDKVLVLHCAEFERLSDASIAHGADVCYLCFYSLLQLLKLIFQELQEHSETQVGKGDIKIMLSQ